LTPYGSVYSDAVVKFCQILKWEECILIVEKLEGEWLSFSEIQAAIVIVYHNLIRSEDLIIVTYKINGNCSKGPRWTCVT
jgi:hypothetical protein